MKLNQITITINDVDDEHAGLNYKFDPLPDSLDDLEPSPCLSLFSLIMNTLDDGQDRKEQSFH